jgi:uncharacterized membrane protein (GlpM family)
MGSMLTYIAYMDPMGYWDDQTNYPKWLHAGIVSWVLAHVSISEYVDLTLNQVES